MNQMGDAFDPAGPAVDPFAEISADELATGETPKSKSSGKAPILPVPADAPACEYRHPRWGRPVAIWAYRDGEGRLLGYDARFEYVEEGQQRKDVLPLTFCDLGDGTRAWRSNRLLKKSRFLIRFVILFWESAGVSGCVARKRARRGSSVM